MEYRELEKYKSIVYKIVGKNSVELADAASSTAMKYYSSSAAYYRRIHSAEGAMHLPVEFSKSTPHTKKLRYQAEVVEQSMKEHGYASALELGCGMGFNTNYLAERNPEKQFTGVDLTPINIQHATRDANGRANVVFYQNDFNQLNLREKSYDLIFAVETLCYAKNLSKLLEACAKLLSENGRIIIFDGYEKYDERELKAPERDAYKLLSWGFVLERFQKLSEVSDQEKLYFLQLEEIKEYSEHILPNWGAFQRGAKRAFRFPLALKILIKLRIVPAAIVRQLSAGLFGYYLIDKGFLGYYKVEFSKKHLPASKHVFKSDY